MAWTHAKVLQAIREAVAEAEKEWVARGIVTLCVCANGDNPPPDCPCVVCTVRRAEERAEQAEADLRALRETDAELDRDRIHKARRIFLLEGAFRWLAYGEHEWSAPPAAVAFIRRVLGETPGEGGI